ncbi:hypothetical protein CLIB1444_01S05666 [[Candida] jaroonii]|uniref:Uncharacterized protein n=1 Tax=[Candida] jaroonii TaxID=467808 RepID=A0ACA9Y1E1_9ASCO|nr:hypothetical protein CLIB1444_01S05666 [[Candida] jaroonii]
MNFLAKELTDIKHKDNIPVKLPPIKSFLGALDRHKTKTLLPGPKLNLTSSPKDYNSIKTKRIRILQRQIKKKVNDLRGSFKDLEATQATILELETLLKMLNAKMKILRTQSIEIASVKYPFLSKSFIYHNDYIFVPSILIGIQQIISETENRVLAIRSSSYRISMNVINNEEPLV